MRRIGASWVRTGALCATALLWAACASPPPPEAEKLSVGMGQREIKAGLGQAAVREALGAPTPTSGDSQHPGVWACDPGSSHRIDTARRGGGGMIQLIVAKA